MTRAFAVVLILAELVAGCATPVTWVEGQVIADVTVVSPERDAPLEHAYVRIAHGRIAEISQTRIFGTEAEIDGRGRYLIPGLIDSHVHLADIPGMRFDQQSAHPEIAAAARAQFPRSYLYFGFTTVVDLAGSAELDDIWNGLEVRPDAYFCGAAPIANGYPIVNIPEAVRFQIAPYFLYDDRQADQIPASIDPSEHRPERVVARMAADGAICVKTHHESGFGAMRDLPTPTVEMVEELVAAAHARDMAVFLHANKESAQAFGLEAGVDVIAHGMWHWIEQDAPAPTDGVAVIVKEVADRDVGYQPTIQVLYGELDLFNADYFGRQGVEHAAPRVLLDWYASEEGGWFRDVLAEFMGPGAKDPADSDALRRVNAVVGMLSAWDARFVFGSDTPSDSTYANLPGVNGRFEMDRWIAAGVSEEQLFHALTAANARALNLDDEIGTVEAGKLANLLLLTENPLESVEAYDSIETVFLRGRPITRETLSALNAP